MRSGCIKPAQIADGVWGIWLYPFRNSEWLDKRMDNVGAASAPRSILSYAKPVSLASADPFLRISSRTAPSI
jgi:hypothetical protein